MRTRTRTRWSAPARRLFRPVPAAQASAGARSARAGRAPRVRRRPAPWSSHPCEAPRRCRTSGPRSECPAPTGWSSAVPEPLTTLKLRSTSMPPGWNPPFVEQACNAIGQQAAQQRRTVVGRAVHRDARLDVSIDLRPSLGPLRRDDLPASLRRLDTVRAGPESDVGHAGVDQRQQLGHARRRRADRDAVHERHELGHQPPMRLLGQAGRGRWRRAGCRAGLAPRHTLP